MAKLPAYITIAFDFTGAITIQQIQYREVLEVDGVLTEVKQYPPDLITAPQANDLITATVKDLAGAVAAGHIVAVREATTRAEQAEAAKADAEAEAAAADALAKARAEADAAEARAELEAKDASIQALLAELEAAKAITVVDALAHSVV